MKKHYRQAIAFLLVWFCSGVIMYSYQVGNKILGITFTFLSFLYWFIIDKDDQENNFMNKIVNYTIISRPSYITFQCPFCNEEVEANFDEVDFNTDKNLIEQERL